MTALQKRLAASETARTNSEKRQKMEHDGWLRQNADLKKKQQFKAEVDVLNQSLSDRDKELEQFQGEVQSLNEGIA